MASADMNNDGLADVVTVSPSSKDVTTFLADRVSGSRFFRARSMRVGDTLRGMAIGDLDRDGRLDVVVADQAGDGVHILLGKGDGTYIDPYLIGVPNSRKACPASPSPISTTSAAPTWRVIDRRENKVFILLNDNGSPPRFRRGGDFVVGLDPSRSSRSTSTRTATRIIVTLDLGGPRVKDALADAVRKREQQGFPEFEEPVQPRRRRIRASMIAADTSTTTARPTHRDAQSADRHGSGELRSTCFPALPARARCCRRRAFPNAVPLLHQRGQPCKGSALTAGDYDGNGTDASI